MKNVVAVTGVMLASVLAASPPLPLVYGAEDTGANVKMPPLPAYDQLAASAHLPDPFRMANGRRMTRRDQWRTRRAEIKALIEHYGAGVKPGRPAAFTSAFSGNTLTVTLGDGDHALP